VPVSKVRTLALVALEITGVRRAARCSRGIRLYGVRLLRALEHYRTRAGFGLAASAAPSRSHAWR